MDDYDYAIDKERDDDNDAGDDDNDAADTDNDNNNVVLLPVSATATCKAGTRIPTNSGGSK